MAGKSLEDLNSDEPPPPGPDVYGLARSVAAARRQAPLREGRVIALYRPLGYLETGVEQLSNEVTGGAKEPASTALLQVGLGIIRNFPGVAEIIEARSEVLPVGDAETMDWFNRFPLAGIDLRPMGTYADDPFRFHAPIELANQVSKLAGLLGLSISRFTIFPLEAGLLCAPTCCSPKYRQAMLQTLRDFRHVLERRAAEATARAAQATPRDKTQDHLYTIADLIGPWPSNETDDDD